MQADAGFRCEGAARGIRLPEYSLRRLQRSARRRAVFQRQNSELAIAQTGTIDSICGTLPSSLFIVQLHYGQVQSGNESHLWRCCNLN